jgi:hypothetical protein
MPPEAHSIALKIKKRNPSLKWIASFGDPIYNSPYSTDEYQTSTNRENRLKFYKSLIKLLLISILAIFANKSNRICLYKARSSESVRTNIYKYYSDKRINFEKNRKGKLETVALDRADLLIFNNKYQKEFMTNRLSTLYKGSPNRSHPFDKDLYHKKSSSKNEKIIISHVGHLDHTRNALALIKAMDRLKQYDIKKYNDIELHFYGTVDEKSRLYILEHKLTMTSKYIAP